MPIRIAMTGAGSIGFTRRLLRDVLAVPELQDTVFAFHDISQRNLDMVAQLCRRDIEASKLPARVEASTDRSKMIAGADYVICTIRQGGLEAFQTDIDIPLKYGVDQCVGDTLCAGGIMYGQRTIPVLLDICRDIRELAKPGAVLLNYSNPMAMNTWACNQFGGVPTIGLCHGIQGAHWQITSCAEIFAKENGIIPRDYVSPGRQGKDTLDYAGGFRLGGLHRREVDVVFAGINHQAWCIRASFRGHDLIPLLPSLFARHPRFPRTEKVRIDVLNRFGLYSTESNGHLSEYLPWYRKRTEEIGKWIDLSHWIHGETGGYLRVCTEGRNWFETDFPNWMKETPQPIDASQRSEEHGSYIIEAIQTGRVYRGHFNVMNQRHISNLPDGCCVEIPGYVDRTGINMTVVGDLPWGCASTCISSINVQRMSMLAAVRGDVNLLKLAMLHDPLVGAVCDPEEAWQMTDEMLVAQRQWLPNYQPSDIDDAEARLRDHEKNGTRVELRQTRGAARLHTRTVEEMAAEREEARRNAQAADKGSMTVG